MSEGKEYRSSTIAFLSHLPLSPLFIKTKEARVLGLPATMETTKETAQNDVITSSGLTDTIALSDAPSSGRLVGAHRINTG
ncbi:hypothetical protein U1Q18_049427 [Sarracenia purpurea var. burkii]